MYSGFWWGNLNDGDHLEETDLDGRIIVKLSFKEWVEGNVDWINLAHELDR